MATVKRQVDGRIQIVTPENIAFEYRIVGPFWRFQAYLIDLFIRIAAVIALLMVLMIVFGTIGLEGFGFGIWLFLFFVADWFYGGLFETFMNGQTPGKRLLRLRVVTVEGQPINAKQAVLRNILRAVDAFPMVPIGTYLVGLISCSMNDRFQRLGDLASGTMVVMEEPNFLVGVTQVKDPAVIELASTIPARFIASRSLTRALSKYVQRRNVLAPARRAEIARYLGRILVEKLELPQNTNHDMLLCAIYYRTFISDQVTEAKQAPVMATLSHQQRSTEQDPRAAADVPFATQAAAKDPLDTFLESLDE